MWKHNSYFHFYFIKVQKIMSFKKNKTQNGGKASYTSKYRNEFQNKYSIQLTNMQKLISD